MAKYSNVTSKKDCQMNKIKQTLLSVPIDGGGGGYIILTMNCYPRNG